MDSAAARKPVPSNYSVRRRNPTDSECLRIASVDAFDPLSLLLSAVLPSLRDRAALQLELIALRHQLLGYCQRNVGVPTNPDRQWFQAAI